MRIVGDFVVWKRGVSSGSFGRNEAEFAVCLTKQKSQYRFKMRLRRATTASRRFQIWEILVCAFCMKFGSKSTPNSSNAITTRHGCGGPPICAICTKKKGGLKSPSPAPVKIFLDSPANPVKVRRLRLFGNSKFRKI